MKKETKNVKVRRNEKEEGKKDRKRNKEVNFKRRLNSKIEFSTSHQLKP